MQYLVSICIPAYKRISFVKRLLDSIATQTCKNFEVIVTDDSPDNSINELCQGYNDKYPLFYYRNQNPLGTPENWNEAIRRAKGQWIKLMHDDDWFTDEQSLARFETAVQKNPSASFIFSAYRNIFLDENRNQDVFMNSFRFWLARLNPVTLLSQNIVGPPSVVMHKNDGKFFYDPKLKWLVDIDFYIRYFHGERPLYIPGVSVNVGIGREQVTRDCFGQRPVEIPDLPFVGWRKVCARRHPARISPCATPRDA